MKNLYYYILLSTIHRIGGTNLPSALSSLSLNNYRRLMKRMLGQPMPYEKYNALLMTAQLLHDDTYSLWIGKTYKNGVEEFMMSRFGDYIVYHHYIGDCIFEYQGGVPYNVSTTMEVCT